MSMETRVFLPSVLRYIKPTLSRQKVNEVLLPGCQTD